jgi:hypothetical protein
VAAKLARLGWSIAEVRHLVKAIATEASDEELTDRLKTVDTTFASLAPRQQISGEERFNQFVGAGIAANIQRWACSLESFKNALSCGSEK